MTKRQRYLYNGYVQIAEIDATNENAPQVVKTYLWNPSEPVATRILHMNLWNNGEEMESLYYTHDLQKNVTALFGQAAGRRAQYEYDPYGNLINITGDAAGLNPYRYSSEYHDEDLGLIYYNYRHYNPTDGRWINRDPIAEQGGINLYGFVRNRAGWAYDWLGLYTTVLSLNLQGQFDGKILRITMINNKSAKKSDKNANEIPQFGEEKGFTFPDKSSSGQLPNVIFGPFMIEQEIEFGCELEKLKGSPQIKGKYSQKFKDKYNNTYIFSVATPQLEIKKMETVIKNSKSDQVKDPKYSCECARGEKKVVKEITIAYDIQFKMEMATTLGEPASNTPFSELENKQVLLFRGENIKHKTISFECCE